MTKKFRYQSYRNENLNTKDKKWTITFKGLDNKTLTGVLGYMGGCFEFYTQYCDTGTVCDSRVMSVLTNETFDCMFRCIKTDMKYGVLDLGVKPVTDNWVQEIADDWEDRYNI